MSTTRVANSSHLSMQFNCNQFAIQKNTDGLDHADSMALPQPAGNCINWVLGHILATRRLVHELVGLDPPLSDEEARPYERGSGPLRPGDPGLRRLDTLLADYNRSQEQVLERLARMTDEDLARPLVDDDGGTTGSRLARLQFHEAYHAGQLGILRRLAGKAGAIQ